LERKWLIAVVLEINVSFAVQPKSTVRRRSMLLSLFFNRLSITHQCYTIAKSSVVKKELTKQFTNDLIAIGEFL